jgi:tRNA(adenine34) deaminase
LYWSQLDKIVYAAKDEHRGALKMNPSLFHPKTTISQGPLSEECSQLINAFFTKKRK